jgi:hypothetical protein
LTIFLEFQEVDGREIAFTRKVGKRAPTSILLPASKLCSLAFTFLGEDLVKFAHEIPEKNAGQAPGCLEWGKAGSCSPCGE